MNASRIPHILLVDDTPTNLRVLSDALQHQNWKTLVAPDGESALEQVKYIQPDLILLDVMMPGIDGFETCRQLKTNPETASIPIIFMTSLSDTAEKLRGLSLGAVDYITKPFQQEEMIARVKLHLRLSQLTHRLEEEVADRTQALSQSLEKLQTVQVQLIHSEKMSSLGQLVSGIGHEINNPINFIGGNLHFVEQYMHDLCQLISLYEQRFPSDDEIREFQAEIELDYLKEDCLKLTQSMRDGVQRIKEISNSLRTYARADINSRSVYDVHHGLDSTLLLLRHRLNASKYPQPIQVNKDYGDIPKINCYPGQLNQVFMNLLSNAIDAIDEQIQHEPTDESAQTPTSLNYRIDIHTHCDMDAEMIVVSIQDNAGGIPPEIQSQVFQPTFTTKAVGKGTGLGLPISYQIVVGKHDGQLNFQSEVGHGTTFTIKLPIGAVEAA